MARGTVRATAGRGEAGFTLLELSIAMLLISVAVAGLVGVLGTSFKSAAIDIHRTDAAAVAAQALAELEAAPVSGPLPGVTRNGQAFTLTGTVAGATASNGDPGAYPSLTVTVAWTDQAGAHTLTQSTARFPGPTTSTTTGSCLALTGVSPTVTAPSTGDAALDVVWTEPMGGAVTQWQVQVSPDNRATWTTAAVEAPLPGAQHRVEIGGLAPGSKYAAQVIAITSCGPPQEFDAGPPATTPALATGPCAPGSVTLSTPVADRLPGGPLPGALTGDIRVVVTLPAPCPAGVWVGTISNALNGDVISAALTVDHTGMSWSGVLPGGTDFWDLGLHQVDVGAGVPDPYNLPAPALATAVLCVEQQGSASC